MSERFELAIVGGGPAGLAAGVTAAAHGLSHVVLERGRLANTVQRYQKGKHVMAEPERLPLQAGLALSFEADSRERVLERWERDVRERGVNLRSGPGCEVVRVVGEKGDFRLGTADGSELSCATLVLAIGVQGNLRRFGVPGDDLPHVTHQLDDPAEHVGRRIVVVGAGDAGIENALALVESDNDVSIVNRREEFDRAKPRNRSLVEAAIRAGRLAYFPNAGVARLEPERIVLQVGGDEVALPADLVIGRLGATPPRRFLEAIGIEFPTADADAVPLVSPVYESNVPGVHVLGALAGYPLIKNCMNQGFEVVRHLVGEPVPPADEPLLAEVLAPLPGRPAEILDRLRASIPLFRGLNSVQLRELLVDATLHRPAAGEIVYERNDFSDGFYLIVEGSVEALVPVGDAERDTGREGEVALRSIPLGSADFFGEGSLLSGRRRAGTIRAGEGAVLLEIPRLAMNRLVHSVTEVKRVVDRAFVGRHLANLVPEVSPAEREALAASAVIATFEAGAELFREGDPPDGLHLIRRGAVTISKERAGRERVIEYVQAGNLVGEIALLAPDRVRSATVRASVTTETIRLPTETILPFIAAHPELRSRLEDLEAERLVENVALADDRPGTELVKFLMDAGAGEATDLLLVDEALCIRCDNCEKACAGTHGGVSRLDREAGPTVGTVHVPTACRHCENPKCMTDCPPDVIRRHPNGEIYIMDGCIGCGNCASYCPYDVIQMEVVGDSGRPNVLLQLLFGAGRGGSAEGEKVAVKCDLCRNLPQPARGPKRAACVEACPTGAIVRVDPRAYVDEILGTRS